MWPLEKSRSIVALAAVCLFLSSNAPATPTGYESDTRAYNLAHGRVVFQDNCLRCHESGRKGAPVIDDALDWFERLDQPLAALIDHAIDGHGDMPARGETQLTDQEIAAAVAYVVNHGRIVVAEQLSELPAPGAGIPPINAGQTPESESVDDAVVRMFLLLLGKDRWK